MYPTRCAGLIAVNYAARARGITRHMRTAQAMETCPDLVLVHVQTIGTLDTHTHTHTHRIRRPGFDAFISTSRCCVCVGVCHIQVLVA